MATASKEPGCLILFREKTRGSQNQIRLWPGALRSHHSFCSVPQKPPQSKALWLCPHCPGRGPLGPSRLGGEVTGP